MTPATTKLTLQWLDRALPLALRDAFPPRFFLRDEFAIVGLLYRRGRRAARAHARLTGEPIMVVQQ